LRNPGGINPNYKPADGSFEIQGVNPGEYVFVAGIPNEPNLAITMPLLLRADADGMVLTLRAGGNLTGSVRIESNSRPNAPAFASARVQLRSETNGIIQTSRVANDGSFQFNGVQQDNYRLSVVGLTDGFYVKDAKLAEMDVLSGAFRYDASGNATLNILFSSNAGVVSGAVTNGGGQLSPGAQVVLIPQNRQRIDLFQAVIADAAGRFVMPSVAPGEYTLAAWEQLEPYAFFDPTVMRQADLQGKTIRVVESSKQTVDLPGMR
jgi:hypothetical protein